MAEFDPLEFKDIEFKVRRPSDGATIKDVYAKRLVTNVDGRGELTEIWSRGWSDADKLVGIEHSYFNLTDVGIIKGWHWHERTFSQYVCLGGKMQIVLVDLRKDSPTFTEVNQFLCSSKNPMYIKIPPHVLKGWKALEPGASIINNLSTADKEDNFKVPVATFLPGIWQPIPE